MLVGKDNFEFIRKCVFLAHTGKLDTQSEAEDSEMGIKLVDDLQQKQEILKEGHVIFKRKNHKDAKYEIKLIKFNSNQYLYLHTKKGDFFIQQSKGFNSEEFVLLLWLAFSLSLLVLYMSIFKSLYPLKKLRNQIEQFKKGNLDINLNINRKDEIGFIAKEFEEAINNIKKIADLRKWFLRNVAHELKTPIAKGKIATELLEDEKRKKHFQIYLKD
ncbi:MAG: HAMP domain-containing protein [Candidatus Micrarchaeaceae archaeon]